MKGWVLSILFAIGPLRPKLGVLFAGAAMVVLFGVVPNRLNVSIIGLLPYTGNVYSPWWMETVVTVTLVTLGVILFGVAAEHLPVFPRERKPALQQAG